MRYTSVIQTYAQNTAETSGTALSTIRTTVRRQWLKDIRRQHHINEIRDLDIRYSPWLGNTVFCRMRNIILSCDVEYVEQFLHSRRIL